MIDVLLDVLMIVVSVLLGYLICKLKHTKKRNAFNPFNEPTDMKANE